MLVTADVDALFTNILHEDGLKCLKEELDKRPSPKVPTEYLIKLMDIIFNQNIFSFHESLWKQKVGAAMGSKPVPSYANIFMARILDRAIKNLGTKYNKDNIEAIEMLKRFLDDYFLIFNGTTKDLHKLLKEINEIHPTMNLTFNHTTVPGERPEDKCDCKEQSDIPFLDTLCRIEDGKIETDLYKKKTDRNQYLLPTSCHPKQTTNSIPHSLALRILRICSNPEKREQRLGELKSFLLERGYKSDRIEAAFKRVRRVPREAALRRVNRKDENKRPVFAITYDPRLPSISSLQAKHWRAMVSRDQYLGKVFPSPPLTAFRRQPNLRSHIIRAAVAKAPERYPKRDQWGVKKCNQNNCTACPYIREGKNITINGAQWRLQKKMDCNSYNVVYAIICKKENCRQVYLGETKRMLKFRLADHRGYVVNQDTTTATGRHFNLPGHSLADLSISIIEQVRKNDTLYRKEREEFHIRRFDTLHRGLNRKF